MADNFLERRMEELRQQKHGAYAPNSRQKAARSNATHRGVLYDKRVFVTGGAHGIGRAMVKAFRDAGCRVAFCDNDNRLGSETAQSLGARFYPLDVTDTKALQNAMMQITDDWGDIDIIINNVGISDFKPLTECNIEEFERILHTNLRPVFITARFMAMHRPAPAYGRIINIASTRHAMSESGTEAYAASKGAIVSLTHALMMSLSPLGITVNAISPGWIECGDRNALRPIDHSFHPSGRVGNPSDIARMAIFLAHPDNDFINGENITIDGGVTKKMIYPED
jgi:hypothetical protein